MSEFFCVFVSQTRISNLRNLHNSPPPSSLLVYPRVVWDQLTWIQIFFIFFWVEVVAHERGVGPNLWGVQTSSRGLLVREGGGGGLG